MSFHLVPFYGSRHTGAGTAPPASHATGGGEDGGRDGGAGVTGATKAGNGILDALKATGDGDACFGSANLHGFREQRSRELPSLRHHATK